MFNFIPEKTRYWPLLSKENIFKSFKFFSLFFLLIFLISILFFKVFIFIFLFLSFLFYYFWIFFQIKLKRPRKTITLKNITLRPETNLAQFLDFECLKSVFNCFKISQTKKKNFINSSLLLYTLLEVQPTLGFIYNRLLFDLRKLRNDLLADYFHSSSTEFFSQDFQNVIIKAIERAKNLQREEVLVSDLVFALFDENKILEQWRVRLSLKKDDFFSVVEWYEYLKNKIEEQKRFWDKKNLSKWGFLARDLAEGFTVTLDNFSYNIFDLLKREGFKEIFAHKDEVKELERILAGVEKNDALIVGDRGSARRSIVEAFAQRSFLGESLESLNYQRILYFDISKLIAQSGSIEEAESLIDQCFNEATMAGNVILVLDNLHYFVGVEEDLARKPGTVEISGALSRYISDPRFRFVAITTYEGLHRNLEKKPELLDLMQKIEVKEVTSQETMLILKERVLRLENKYKVFVPFVVLREIINICERYLASQPFPEKAINILDEMFVWASQHKKRIILLEDLYQVVSQKIEIPLGKVQEKEKDILLNMENLLHQRVVDQEEAIFQVSNALRRARSDIRLRKGPMGSFLFLGPTGVGKTETAKALAEIYFGSEEKIIRLDMSEFQRVEDIPRLLGLKGEESVLTTPVLENPFSLILLDEFEKAHRDIFNLFLQVLDEGHLTDGWGRKVDFKNTIIIATSNAGYQMIFEATKKGEDLNLLKEKLINYFVEQGIFRPELLNRFDAVVIFKPLSPEHLLMICQLLLGKIQKQLKEKDINLIISDALKEKIVQLSYKPEFGAREMQRVIQEHIGNNLALSLLENKIQAGMEIEINPEDFSISIKSQK